MFTSEKLGNGELFLGDALEVLKTIRDNSIDLVLTDPPYNASTESHISMKFGNRRTPFKAVDEEWDKEFKPDFFDLCVPKLKMGGSLITFCSFHLLKDYLMKESKEMKLQQILHWHKTNPVPSMTKTYAYSIEYILWFVKTGEAYTFNKPHRHDYKDVFKTIVGEKKVTNHPTEKPLSLIQSLLLTHSNENDLVCDPFLGSGTLAVVCEKSNRRWIGIELDQNYYNIAKSRISPYINQKKLDLFDY